MGVMNTPETQAQTQAAARALLAFWRAAGVDMDAAEAVYSGSAAPAAPVRAPNPAPTVATRPTPRPRARADAPIEAAQKLAAEAQTLGELRRAVEGFAGCALKATARNTVFADGTEGAPVLVIGQAPGREEDEAGRPFVGKSGQLLDRMLAAIGLDRTSNVLISNTIYWRPPGDRDPTPGEIAVCLPFVQRLIALAQPKLIVFTGKIAIENVLGRSETPTKLSGRRLDYQGGLSVPVNAMVMLHPAYLLRQPQQKRRAWADLLAAKAWLDELGVRQVTPS